LFMFVSTVKGSSPLGMFSLGNLEYPPTSTCSCTSPSCHHHHHHHHWRPISNHPNFTFVNQNMSHKTPKLWIPKYKKWLQFGAYTSCLEFPTYKTNKHTYCKA
jgi:hypothetical protein